MVHDIGTTAAKLHWLDSSTRPKTKALGPSMAPHPRIVRLFAVSTARGWLLLLLYYWRE